MKCDFICMGDRCRVMICFSRSCLSILLMIKASCGNDGRFPLCPQHYRKDIWTALLVCIPTLLVRRQQKLIRLGGTLALRVVFVGFTVTVTLTIAENIRWCTLSFCLLSPACKISGRWGMLAQV